MSFYIQNNQSTNLIGGGMTLPANKTTEFPANYIWNDIGEEINIFDSSHSWHITLSFPTQDSANLENIGNITLSGPCPPFAYNASTNTLVIYNFNKS